MRPSVLVATWNDGVFVCSGDEKPGQELAQQAVAGLAPDGRGGALAIAGGHTLCRRSSEGEWSTVATSHADLACCVAVGDDIYLGTNDARVIRLHANGHLEPLPGFDAMAGRQSWVAGTFVVDGRVLGPPLGVRTIEATPDGSVLFANVHVGGVPRSTDGGQTWHPTIDVDADVHEVRAHPERSDLVVAASAMGLQFSRDAGLSFECESEGMHDPYCSAVAFAGDDILVAASKGHFAPDGALYRRAIDAAGPVVPVEAGLPRWLNGIVETRCIAVHREWVALADRGGNLYLSSDHGKTWSGGAQDLPTPSGVLIL